MRPIVVGAGLLLSAFGPLAAVILLAGAPLPVRWWNDAAAGLALVATGTAWLSLRAARSSQELPLRTGQARQQDIDVLALLGAQMVPVVLAVFADADPARQVAMGLYLVIFAVVYVRGRLYYLNPALTLVGFHVWELELENGQSVRLLSRADFVPQRAVLRAHRLAPGVYVAARGHPSEQHPSEQHPSEQHPSEQHPRRLSRPEEEQSR